MGTHGLSCKLGTGRLARHQQLNDLVWRALERASIPSCREPRNLLRDSELRPDGLTLIPWKEGKCLTWDVTVADTLAATYVSATSVKAGEVITLSNPRSKPVQTLALCPQKYRFDHITSVLSELYVLSESDFQFDTE